MNSLWYDSNMQVIIAILLTIIAIAVAPLFFLNVFNIIMVLILFMILPKLSVSIVLALIYF